MSAGERLGWLEQNDKTIEGRNLDCGFEIEAAGRAQCFVPYGCAFLIDAKLIEISKVDVYL